MKEEAENNIENAVCTVGIVNTSNYEMIKIISTGVLTKFPGTEGNDDCPLLLTSGEPQ